MPQTNTKTTLLSSTSGFLALRVSGGKRDGQLVRLQSPKCIIGSGPNCTLRLRAAGVEPVHCLVLRGSEQTIVRRWSADTRLNGRSFNEAALQPGDRLSIGRIDLLVIDTSQPETPSEARLSQQKAIDDRLNEIEVRLRSLDEQQAECDTREADLAVLRNDWETRQAEAQKQCESRESELAAGKVQLEAARASLDEERRLWEANRDSWNVCRAAEAEQLAARQTELEALRGAFEERQAAWKTEIAENTNQHSNLQGELNRMRTEVEAAQTTLADERREWQTQQADASTAEAMIAEQLTDRQAELEAAQRLMDELNADWQADISRRDRQKMQIEAELDRLRAEFESAQTAFAKERSTWEAARHEAAQTQSIAAGELAAARAELDARIRAFEEQKSGWEKERAAAQSSLDDRLAGLDALQVDLDSQRAALEKQRRQLEAPSAESANAPVNEASTRTEQPVEMDLPSYGPSEPRAAEGDEAPESPAPQSKAGPVDLAAVLRRTGYTIDLIDQELAGDNVAVDKIAQTMEAEKSSMSITSPAPRTDEPVPAHEEEDVSIDDYMSRLLARSRGGAVPARRPTATVKSPGGPSAAAATKIAPESATPTSVAPSLRSSEPIDLAPRAPRRKRTSISRPCGSWQTFRRSRPSIRTTASSLAE